MSDHAASPLIRNGRPRASTRCRPRTRRGYATPGVLVVQSTGFGAGIGAAAIVFDDVLPAATATSGTTTTIASRVRTVPGRTTAAERRRRLPVVERTLTPLQGYRDPARVEPPDRHRPQAAGRLRRRVSP